MLTLSFLEFRTGNSPFITRGALQFYSFVSHIFLAFAVQGRRNWDCQGCTCTPCFLRGKDQNSARSLQIRMAINWRAPPDFSSLLRPCSYIQMQFHANTVSENKCCTPSKEHYRNEVYLTRQNLA